VLCAGSVTLAYGTTDDTPIPASPSGADAPLAEEETASCFSARDTVQLRSGQVKSFDTLAVGDDILTLSEQGLLEYSEVVYLPHGHNKQQATFIELTLEGGRHSLRMTPDHLVGAVQAEDCARMLTNAVDGASDGWCEGTR
jgi:hypothetical protein